METVNPHELIEGLRTKSRLLRDTGQHDSAEFYVLFLVFLF